MFGLSTLATQLIGAVVIAVSMFGAGTYTGYRFESGVLQARIAADTKAEEIAIEAATKIQKDQDAVAEKGAIAEAAAQEKIIIQTKTLTQEIVRHVPTTVACIPVGLVRVLNASAKGLAAPDQSFAAGQPDDACAPVSWRAFADDIADDYGTGNQNAEQLNALEASIRDLNAAATGASQAGAASGDTTASPAP